MKKFVFIMLVLVLTMCAAFSEETFLKAYERVEMNFTYEEISKLFGKCEEQDGFFLFEDEVLCVFYESGRLQAKARVFDDLALLAPVAEYSSESLKKLKQGTSIEEVTEIFSVEGLEIMRINLSDEENPGVRRVLAWQNAEKANVQALFELDDGEWVLFAIAESPAPLKN